MTAFGILLIFFTLYYGGQQLIERISSAGIIQGFAGIFGKDLAVDEFGRTNILIFGIGGEGHEGKDLTDTTIVLSLASKQKRVSIISIPRDLYVIDSVFGGGRINLLYDQGKAKWGPSEGLDFARATISKIFNVPLQYVIKVDFQAVEKIVDSVGGIDVYVEKTINDPFYPKGETSAYEVFFLAQGNQHLDGKTALKYARSRETTSDFDRSKRQQQILVAIKSKAESENLFRKEALLKELYYSIRDHIETNMSLQEMLSLASFASAWDSRNLVTATLHDDPTSRGGFLYTPMRKLYKGAFVLLPAGDNFESVQKFMQIVFSGPPDFSKKSIAILNGTKEVGLANRVSRILNRFGVRISFIGNAAAKDKEKTIWYAPTEGAQDMLLSLKELVPGDWEPQMPDVYKNNPELVSADLILELGKDSKQIIEKLDIFRNVVSLVPTVGTTTENPK